MRRDAPAAESSPVKVAHTQNDEQSSLDEILLKFGGAAFMHTTVAASHMTRASIRVGVME